MQRDFDNIEALKAHRKSLECETARKNTLIATIDKTIRHIKGDNLMKFEELYSDFDGDWIISAEIWQYF